MPKATIEDILAAVPAKPTRSRLEPYRALIEELRRRNITYREIAQILAEQCDIHVSRAAVHDFLKSRTIQSRVRSAAPDAPKSASTPITAQGDEHQHFEFDASKPLSFKQRSR